MPRQVAVLDGETLFTRRIEKGGFRRPEHVHAAMHVWMPENCVAYSTSIHAGAVVFPELTAPSMSL
jgi:hypothetical protein